MLQEFGMAKGVKPQLNEEQIHEILRLFLDEKLSISKIAKRMDRSKATITKHLMKRKVLAPMTAEEQHRASGKIRQFRVV